MFVFGVDTQSVYFRSSCLRYEMSQLTKFLVDPVLVGSKCSEDVKAPERRRCSSTCTVLLELLPPSLELDSTTNSINSKQLMRGIIFTSLIGLRASKAIWKLARENSKPASATPLPSS
jgi:hypothetical protein